jgi:RNA ligase
MAKLDIARLRELEASGLITSQRHPAYPLLIFNYTQKCQYLAAWDECTLMCRGLITDLDGQIVARPFPKFFNFYEHANPRLPTIDWRQGFTATEKIDGSLAILYQAGGRSHLATRGSFTSEQAKAGAAIFHEKGYDRFDFDPTWTYLFELIYPGNRVVLDYGLRRDLILLDAIHIDGDRSLSYDALARLAGAIGCPIVGRVPLEAAGEEAFREFARGPAPNSEGIVVRFDDGLRVKVKYDEYTRLLKLLATVNAQRIWECVRDGEGLEGLMEEVPDEFHAWVKSVILDLGDRFEKTRSEAQEIFDATRRRLGEAARKEYAAEFVRHRRLSAILFRLLDGNDPAPIIWEMIRPEAGGPPPVEP